MPVTVRRQPSVDLRKAARLAELATKNEIESFSLEDDMESLYRSKIRTTLNTTTTTYPSLRLATSSPVLSQLYQSDEEQISPQTEEFYDSGSSEYESCEEDSADELDFDGDDEDIDFEIHDIETVSIKAALAIAVPIQLTKANLVDITSLAPMAKRFVPISRPQSASYATFTRVKVPQPKEVRTSVIYDRPSTVSSVSTTSSNIEAPVRNFSTLLPRSQSLSPAGSLHSGTSPASSVLSLSNESTESTSEAVIRNSDEYHMLNTVLTGTEWDNTTLESPTPTSWAAYDPFALNIPTLAKANHSTFHGEDIYYEKPKGWKRLGLKSTNWFPVSSKRSIRN